jgi:hypothetical protein
MNQQTLNQRLANPAVMRAYRDIIKHQDVVFVKQLRDSLKEKALDNPRRQDLEQAFIDRLGE